MKSESRVKQKREEDSVDRLPDDVLVHILSRMKTLDAVRTSILSSRWKNLWRLIYNLDFFIGYLRYDKDAPIISRVLKLLQSGNIQTFRLFVDYDVSYRMNHPLKFDRHIDKWAAFAARHNVAEFTLNVDDYGYPCFSVPQSLLTCKSLRKLTLEGNFRIDISDSLLCFPSLKSLHITICTDENQLQIQNLFHHCPVLEDLTINSFIMFLGEDGITFDINLPALRTLHINEDRDFDYPEFRMPNKYVVEAHKLEYLYVTESDTFSYFILGNTPCLNKVSVNVKMNFFHEYFSRNEGNPRLELLSGIRNTRSLVLSSDAARVLSFPFDGIMPMFPNLINLELGCESYFGWKLLPHFLTSSPILQ